jgi:hypothetical protein
MKLFFQEQGAGYGSRIYLSKDINGTSRIYELCKILSAWVSIDKEDSSEFWTSFEFPIFHNINFKDLIATYAFNSIFVEDWEEFLAYCAERKAELGW